MTGSSFHDAFERHVGDSVKFVSKHYSAAFAQAVTEQLQSFAAAAGDDTNAKSIDAFTRRIADETVASTVGLHLGMALQKTLPVAKP